MKHRCTRAFWFKGTPHAKGSVIDLNTAEAAQLLGSVEQIVEKPKATAKKTAPEVLETRDPIVAQPKTKRQKGYFRK